MRQINAPLRDVHGAGWALVYSGSLGGWPMAQMAQMAHLNAVSEGGVLGREVAPAKGSKTHGKGGRPRSARSGGPMMPPGWPMGLKRHGRSSSWHFKRRPTFLWPNSWPGQGLPGRLRKA